MDHASYSTIPKNVGITDQENDLESGHHVVTNRLGCKDQVTFEYLASIKSLSAGERLLRGSSRQMDRDGQYVPFL